MPQEIRVLRCYKCKMFQVDIVKKAKKWQCKICNEKQSVFREIFRGSGAECRQKVQELNFNANAENVQAENDLLGLLENDDFNLEDLQSIENKDNTQGEGKLKISDSKWKEFVDINEENMNMNTQTEEETNCKRKYKESDSSHKSKAFKPSFNNSNSKWNAYL